MGYKPGEGLGKNKQGTLNPIGVKQKFGRGGFGMSENRSEGNSTPWRGLEVHLNLNCLNLKVLVFFCKIM